ncbi:MAG TPA: hypothetical protein DD671_15975 [Balneolaceae bacterium]|nr:hypothetical protein [Balneolaceae bacterium]
MYYAKNLKKEINPIVGFEIPCVIQPHFSYKWALGMTVNKRFKFCFIKRRDGIQFRLFWD